MKHTQLLVSLQAQHRFYMKIFTPFSPAPLANYAGIGRDLATLEVRLQALEASIGHKYSPAQPRVPGGDPAGGQWTDGDGGGGQARTNLNAQDDPDLGPAEPVYPIESILVGLAAGEALGAIRNAIAIWKGIRLVRDEFSDVTRSLEDYFGGPPDRTFTNDNGDIIMMGNGKKVRFDVNDPHGYDPHFHLQEELPNGDWKDAGDQHMYPFKKE